MLLFGELKAGSTAHMLTWGSHKSHRPVKSAASAETFAAAQAIDEGKVLKIAMEDIWNISVQFILVVDSKDLFDSMTSCRNATDRAIRGDISVIRFEFETRAVNKVLWIPGSCNLSDPLTKINSPLTEPLHVLMDSGKIPLTPVKTANRDAEMPTG